MSGPRAWVKSRLLGNADLTRTACVHPPGGYMTDLNYLFHRQQQERSQAAAAASSAGRMVHERLAALYESEIRRKTEGRVDIAPPASLA